jgi:Flp pilus assembly protein TadG
MTPFRRQTGAARASVVRDERGQAIVFLVISLLSLLGMATLVVDVGYGFLSKRRDQAAADASVLAAAQYLPTDTSGASTAAQTYGSKNFKGTMAITYSSTYTTNDTATTNATLNAPSIFGNVFGFSSYATGATASVTVGSYTGYANTAPWTIDVGSLPGDFGASVTFKVNSGIKTYAPGNFGAIDLPIQSGCGTGTGATHYRNLIGGSEHSCMISVGDILPAETGDMGNNTKTALSTRGATQSFDPYTVLTAEPGGYYAISDYNNPNVIVIPVIQTFSNGKADLQVVTFAWFVITDWTKDTVTGMFVRTSDSTNPICPTATNPNNPCPIGAYNQNGIKAIQLNG